jgi:hypothetical protein
MSDSAGIFLLLPGIFLGILLFIEVGHWLGTRFARDQAGSSLAVFSTIETAIYALLGLMVAFTFSGAASRFDTRRTLTVDEANAIGTAYLRLDVLPVTSQPPLRDKFRRYTEARIAVYRVLPDVEASKANAARASALQTEIWADAVTATTRSVILNTHIPPIVLATLATLTLVCSLLIGYGLPRDRMVGTLVHTLAFALVVTVTMYVIFDLDHPRVGLIRLDYADQALFDVLAAMK